ncbi:MAG: glycoside hydrolase family 88 protein [Melioribacteraceae bacterium]|nr:glycoside hydrolase family 88 protein [Melioribacteraceae bacterium]
MAKSLEQEKDLLPKTVDRFGNLQTCKSDWWVSGFFPGQLWYLYEHSKNEEVKNYAVEFSKRVEREKFTTDNHDVGFIIHCSFGNGFRITKDSTYLEIIKTASNSLITRFNKKIGAIRSWDTGQWNKQWQYAVIIDNMMNLEMLLWAAKKFNKPEFYDVAINHANTSMRDHYRSDFSSFHVVSYDTITGAPELKHTAQGYKHESAWARGQSWGFYGFVMMYRFTKDEKYLNQAKSIAGFLINHPRMPEDKIPYWDYDAPNIPDTYRDASAASIMCSALIELSKYVDAELSKKYLAIAETQIRSLYSNFRNAPGNNGNFILKHSVGHMPNNTEVDVPLTYADYYFVEALMRFKKIYD